MNNKNLFYTFLTVFVLLGVYFVSGAITTSLISPTDDTWNLSNSVQFTFKCVGNYSAYNTTLYIDGAANYTFGNTTGIVLNDTETNTTIVTIADATSYLWNVECWGNGSRGGILSRTQAAANFTLKVDTIDPSVTLNIPSNNTWNLSNSVRFAFTVTESNPAECNLTIDGANNKTNSSGITSGSRYTFASTTIGDSSGGYLWNVLCYDQARRSKRASANFTLKVDATNPTGSITMPRTTTIYAQNLIKISCSGTDATSGVDKVRLKITKPSKKVLEYDLDSGKEKILRNIDTGEAGKYYVDCKIYDARGNTYDTEQKSFNAYYRAGKAAAPEEEPEEEITPEEEEAEGVPTEGVPTEKAPSKAWIWILVIVVIILVVYFVLKKKK